MLLTLKHTPTLARDGKQDAWPLLKKGSRFEIQEREATIVLVNCFFCTWPKRSVRSAVLGNCNFQDIYATQTTNEATYAMYQKINSFIQYFLRRLVMEDVMVSPGNKLTFYLHSNRRKSIEDWKDSKKQLVSINAYDRGNIEDQTGSLQADFANAYVGGGIVGHGAVQEEIRFMLCPDLMVGRLVTPMLRDDETLLMRGAERFSNYRGYSRTYAWDGPYEDDTRILTDTRDVDVVAFDAYNFRNKPSEQTKPTYLTRELNKAFSAFTSDGKTTTISTGNWGAGAFGGSFELKFLLQWAAASQARRSSMRYLTFAGISAKKLNTLKDKLRKLKIRNVGELLRRTLRYRWEAKGAVIDSIINEATKAATAPRRKSSTRR